MRCALFDLDNTLYPQGAGVMETVSQRISDYMVVRLGMDWATVNELRPRYWHQYGTTMRGLLEEHQIEAEDYLAYVHDFAVEELLAPNRELDDVLAGLPWRKAIFTNSTHEHARDVLVALGIERHFERVFDVRTTGYVGKPHATAYRFVIHALGVGAEHTVVIDDSLPNLCTARELGMVTVLVGATDKAEDVDFAIARIEDVAAVARQMQAQH